MQTATSMNVGDQVVITIEDIDVIKQMQVNHGGWNDSMKECLVGPCKLIQPVGVDVIVQAPSGRMYRVHSELLSIYDTLAESVLLQSGLPTRLEDPDISNDRNFASSDEARKSSSSTLPDNPYSRSRTAVIKSTELSKTRSVSLNDERASHNKDGALHVAVRNKACDACRQLIANGADVNALNENYMTPIMLAAHLGCKKVLSLLSQHPDARLNIGNEDNDTALHLAVQNSRIDAVQILLEAGANIEAINDQQFTPFHMATMWGNEKILELCLNKYGKALADLQTGNQSAAVHLATLYNHTACLRLLIGHKADLNIRNKKMQTALHIAVSQKNMGCVKILVENNAEIDLLDEDGDTPLHNAIRLHNIDNMTFMKGQQRDSIRPEEIAIYLVEHGANLDTVNNVGQTPLTACKDQALQTTLCKIQEEAENKSCRSLDSLSRVPEPESFGQGTEQLQQTIQNLQDEILCVICRENRTNVAFNCGHRACNSCANNLHDCHMCRQRIVTKNRIY